MNTTITIPTTVTAIDALIERANTAIDAAVAETRDDLMENNQNDYVISVRNMGHDLNPAPATLFIRTLK